MRLLFVAFLAAWMLAGCASSRSGTAGAGPDTCSAVVERDVIVSDSIPPDDSLKVRGALRGRCYTELGLGYVARQKACRDGYAFAHVYNVQPPGYFSGRCAMGDIDFYRVAPVRTPSPRPVTTYERLPNRGLELYATGAAGNALGGNQREPALSPRPSVEKFNLGVDAEYFWNRFGLEAGADYLAQGTARKDGYPGVGLYRSNIFRLGGVATLWDRTHLTYRMKFDASAGGNFTLLRLDDEYVDLLEGDVITDWGNGFGGYARVRVKTFFRNGFATSLGLRYEYENATLEGASDRLDAHNLQVMLALGYKF
jgi:hypothetical protein